MNSVNELEMRVIGLSRSGNHGIIDWILAQTTGRYCFLNCVEPKQNPFRSARLLEHGRSYRTTIRNFALEREATGEFSPKDLLLYSYEDVYLGAVAHPSFEAMREHYLGTSSSRINVLILRDPFNLLASRIRSGLFDNRYIWGEKVVTHRMAMRIWKQHAREFLQSRRLPGRTVGIVYNRWARDPGYRRAILERLGLPLRDSRAPRVARVAGGSSFDGLRHIRSPHQMNVHRRWEQFAADTTFASYFDASSIQLTRRLFGDCLDIDPIIAGIGHAAAWATAR